jgi:hypothetical protein
MTLNTTLVDVAVKDMPLKALNWAVASATRETMPAVWQWVEWDDYRPTSNWLTGGKLVDEYRINFATSGTGPADAEGNEPIIAFVGLYGDGVPHARAMEGKTHLEAACRSIVATYGGDIVKVPACLVLP